MYYSNHDRGHEPWENPIETTGRPVDEPPRKHKRKGSGAKVAALCLACALVGGLAHPVYNAVTGGNGTTIYTGNRTPTKVDTAAVNTEKELTTAEIYAKYVSSCVGITVDIVSTNIFGQTVTGAAAGSGFVITEDGYILTNYHVIEDANTIKVSFVDGTSYDAELVGGEEENDIAVLKIDATGLTPVIIGDSDNVRVGEQVVAIGNPLGELTYSMTSGIISARDRSITMENGEVMNMLQTDTAINSGNSGGPLFDMYGQVIGITSAKLSGSSSSSATIEGLGFAIPINDVKDMVTDIIENGYVTGKPYLGITVSTVPESVSERYGMSQGALVESVDPNSCAATAGIQEGDIITALNGTTVISSAELIEEKKNYSAGDTVTVEVERDGEKQTLSLTFDEDTPERRAAQEEALEQQQQENQQNEQNSSGNSGSDFFWPFGNLSPWFY